MARVLLPPVFLAGLALLGWFGGLIWFAQTIPREEGWADRATDAIVVLTGGSERVSTGVQLLAKGLGHTLFVSGVHQGVELREVLRAAKLDPDTLECCIVLGYEAGDTVGNAAETAAWMASRDYHSLRLVTSNYHMRRSLLEFDMAMPRVDVVPHPVAPDAVKLRDWWRWPGTLALIVNEYNKYLFTLARHSLLS
ncbi:hypothetical protein N825_22215 [Skermanella stibiiresistens SB22]|uniref:DUF218 domain-containing protein n=1 Tax=Skermanella stibiiresistens SB22 TaxID=1385369 RepID=W9GX45_9PROT|nr:hypothetical protein N825_22215 [Skermanella stibiiresistens SB22]